MQRCQRIGFERQARRAEITGDLLIVGTLCADRAAACDVVIGSSAPMPAWWSGVSRRGDHPARPLCKKLGDRSAGRVQRAPGTQRAITSFRRGQQDGLRAARLISVAHLLRSQTQCAGVECSRRVEVNPGEDALPGRCGFRECFAESAILRSLLIVAGIGLSSVAQGSAPLTTNSGALISPTKNGITPQGCCLLRPLAERGMAAARHKLGVLYSEGKGVEQNRRRKHAHGSKEQRIRDTLKHSAVWGSSTGGAKVPQLIPQRR